MSKKRKNVSDGVTEDDVTTDDVTEDDVTTDDVTEDDVTDVTEEDTPEVATAEKAISENTSLIQNEGHPTMANEEKGLANANSDYEQVAMARLYNRNDYPVTLNTTDGNQLVLSPRQKTEPLEAHLLIESEFPSGIIKIDF